MFISLSILLEISLSVKGKKLVFEHFVIYKDIVYAQFIFIKTVLLLGMCIFS